MRAVIVSVDFADLLGITLPYNRHHFDEVLVITSIQDADTERVALDHKAELFRTDSFYEPPAVFNKWKALEEGLDHFGRWGWLCLMDADVLWPKGLTWRHTDSIEGLPLLECTLEASWKPGFRFTSVLAMGNLYTPLRRMWSEWPKGGEDDLVDERRWSHFSLHPQQVEWAGYTQIFHALDRALGPAPWHETNWRHAGGADSFFQKKWPPERKLRPPFEVLHLGESGKNWCGRVIPYRDGKIPSKAESRIIRLEEFIRARGGLRGPARFTQEKY